MKYLAAALLSCLSGDVEPEVDKIAKIFCSIGAQADQKKINNIVQLLKGKDLSQLIEEGKMKIASLPWGGAPATSVPTTTPVAKLLKEEEKEESDDDMGFGLFD